MERKESKGKKNLKKTAKKSKIIKRGRMKKKSREGKKNSKAKILRKDFEVFAKGVERLEELRNELNNLNTAGYEDEASSIKAKLKNVSYIPEIETEMKILKAKIKGAYRGKKVKRKKRGSDAHAKINQKINELRGEIKKKRKNVGGKQLSKIPGIEGQIRALKAVLAKQQADEKRKKELLRRIDPGVNLLINDKFDLTLNEIKAELSERIKAKKSEVHKQLQADLETRKKSFELQYKKLEDRFSEKYKSRVDKSLKREVRKRFNEELKKRAEKFKKELNRENLEKLKEKKQELEAKERRMLEGLKVIENRRLKELDEKEKRRLGELSKEERGMLKEMRKEEKALKEKSAVELSRKLKEEEKQRAKKAKITRQQLKKLKEKLEKETALKKDRLEKEYKNDLIRHKEKLRSHYNDTVLVQRVQLTNRLHEHLTSKIRKLHSEHKRKINQEEQEIGRLKKKLAQEEGILSRVKNRMNLRLMKIKDDEGAYREELKKRLEKEKEETTRKAINNQSTAMRRKLQKEFHEKLKLELKSKKAEFDKKKADLTLEIQRKARQLFA